MSGASELAPCPFCGGVAEMDTQQAYRALVGGQIGTRVAVYCTSCNADMGFCREDASGEDREYLPEWVVEWWNRRTPSDELSRLSSAHSEAVEDARKHLAELSASRAEAGRLREALKEARRAIGDHHAPSDCYATGPLTGDPFRDLVQCPACSFIAMYDAALAGEKPVGAGVETLATDYLRGKIGEIIALQLDIEGGRAVEQAVEQILAVAALSKSGEKP